MGGSTDFRRYRHKASAEARKKTLTKSKVEQLFASDQQSSAYESGHSYSGAIGVMPNGIKWIQTFRTYKEALDYIVENHNKWDQAMGAEFLKDSQQGYGGRTSKKWGGFIVGGWCSS